MPGRAVSDLIRRGSAHETMPEWFGRHARQGWATSPSTQSAFIRIVLQPAFCGRAIGVAQVAELLLRNTEHKQHSLLAMNFGFSDVLGCCTAGLLGHRQITDAYLLTQAIHAKARLLTFDSRIEHLLATAEERQQRGRVLS